MTDFARDLGITLGSELLKMRRTLALALAFLAPLLIVLLEFLVFWQNGEQMSASEGDMWQLLMRNCLLLWDLLMIPLFVTLQTALLAGLEHTNHNWKHLFALPVSRGAIYAAKQIVAMGLIGLSTPILWAAVIAAGWVLRLAKPGIGFEAAPPVWAILKYALLSYVSCWLIVAIHAWVGMRWSSFVVAMGVGVGATIIAVIVMQSDYGPYYPWTLPAVATREAIVNGNLRFVPLAIGVLGGVAVAILGGIDFTRRDVL
jgi:hypothetical protein